MNPRQTVLVLTLLIFASLAVPEDAASQPPDWKLERLCELVNCAPPPATPIVSDWSSSCGLPGVSDCVTPFGALAIFGGNFGSSPGKVLLCGGFHETAGGWPGCVELTVAPSHWFDGFILAELPLIDGVPDHKVNLYVRRAEGLTSSPVVDLQFVAIRDLQRVSEDRVTVTFCSGAAGGDTCKLLNAGTTSVNTGGFTGIVIGGSEIWASHRGGSVAIYGTPGTDRYTVGPLQNGWVLHSFSTSFGGCCAPSVDFFNPGRATANLAVNWQVGGSFGFVGQVMFYVVDIFITGPLGVPF